MREVTSPIATRRYTPQPPTVTSLDRTIIYPILPQNVERLLGHNMTYHRGIQFAERCTLHDISCFSSPIPAILDPNNMAHNRECSDH